MTIIHRIGLRMPLVLVMAFFIQLAVTPVWAAEKVSFSEDIFPILQMRCLACHQPQGEGYEKSGLDLRTYKGLMDGTKYGPMVIAGEPFMSNLVVLIEGRAASAIRMPHGKKKLSSCDKDLIRKWIKQGALDN